MDLLLGDLGHLQAESDVIKNIQMREQRIALEDGVDLPLVRRNIIDRLSIKEHIAGGGV